MTARCVRCDRNLDFFLFRDHCVNECPHGTYRDEITGWCAQCSCNCGDGGCLDKRTCKMCSQPNTMLDKDSGICKCDTKVEAEWSDDWSHFTITIESPKVKFRDHMAETQNGYDFNMKKCRIGNEPIVLGNMTFINTDINNLDNMTGFDPSTLDPATAGNLGGGMFGNSSAGNHHNITYGAGDIPINSCGNLTVREEEIMHIFKEFSSVNIDHTMSPGGMGDSMMGGMTGDGSGSNSSSGGDGSSGNMPPTGSTQDHKIPVGDDTGYCPAQVETYKMQDLYKLGIYSIDDVYWYIHSLGVSFGNITKEMLDDIPDPIEGLEFTSKPSSICHQLFDNYTNHLLDGPTCTVHMDSGNTIITVHRGERAYIHNGMEIKIQPNVFAEGCDMPVLTHLPIADGGVPDSLEIAFGKEDNITICEDLFLIIESEGNVGGLT